MHVQIRKVPALFAHADLCICYGATALRIPPMKQNKDLLKTALLMCAVNAWVCSPEVEALSLVIC